MRSQFNKFKYPGIRDVYIDRERNLIITFASITEDKYASRNKRRCQLSRTKLDQLQKLSLDLNMQVVILGELLVVDTPIYVYMDHSIYFSGNHKSNSSFWFNDNAAFYDAYQTNNIQNGKEHSGTIDTLVFKKENSQRALDLIVARFPKLQLFAETSISNMKAFESKMNTYSKDERMTDLIGLIGEYIFYSTYNLNNIDGKSIEKIKWNFNEGNIYENHDFKLILENKETIFVEVKTTSIASERHIISNNEVEFMKLNKDNFVLVTIKLSNPFLSFILSGKKITNDIVDEFIDNKEYELVNYFRWAEIKGNFNFESKEFELTKK